MMLRASIEHPDNHFEVGLTPTAILAGSGPTGVAESDAIMAFVDAVVLRDAEEYPGARAALERRIGRPATDRAAMVAGNFSMMNRALDAVGAPVDRASEGLAAEIGVVIPDHLRTV